MIITHFARHGRTILSYRFQCKSNSLHRVRSVLDFFRRISCNVAFRNRTDFCNSFHSLSWVLSSIFWKFWTLLYIRYWVLDHRQQLPVLLGTLLMRHGETYRKRVITISPCCVYKATIIVCFFICLFNLMRDIMSLKSKAKKYVKKESSALEADFLVTIRSMCSLITTLSCSINTVNMIRRKLLGYRLH